LIVKLDIPLKKESLKEIPNEIISFTLILYSGENGIKDISLYLNDYRRSITVSGSNNTYVTGLINIIKDKILPYEVYWGGPGRRIIIAVALYLIFLIIFSLLIVKYRCLFCLIQKPENYYTAVIYLVLIFNILCVPAVVLLPWERYFPGCLITTENLNIISIHYMFFYLLPWVFPSSLICLLFYEPKFLARLKEKAQNKNGCS
jgi:hypothetical protein